MMPLQRDRALKYVTLAAMGNGLAGAVLPPGFNTMAVSAAQLSLAQQIGAIYKGESFSHTDALAVCGGVGGTMTLGRAVAYNLLGAIPVAGWLIKGSVASSFTYGFGCALIEYFESQIDYRTEEGLPA